MLEIGGGGTPPVTLLLCSFSAENGTMAESGMLLDVEIFPQLGRKWPWVENGQKPLFGDFSGQTHENESPRRVDFDRRVGGKTIAPGGKSSLVLPLTGPRRSKIPPRGSENPSAERR